MWQTYYGLLKKRLAAGLTQEEVAVVVGCSYMSVRKWERNGRIQTKAHYDNLVRLLGPSDPPPNEDIPEEPE